MKERECVFQGECACTLARNGAIDEQRNGIVLERLEERHFCVEERGKRLDKFVQVGEPSRLGLGARDGRLEGRLVAVERLQRGLGVRTARAMGPPIWSSKRSWRRASRWPPTG